MIFLYAVACLCVVLFLLSLVLSPKHFQLSGAHVLITGGSSGIGRELAIEAAKKGASITIIARNQSILREAKEEIEKHVQNKDSQKVLSLSVDLTADYETVEKEIQKAEASQGPVDMLINCAGFSVTKKFEDIPVSDFRRLMEVNYIGSVSVTKAVLPQMKARQKGRIVFVSSQGGQCGIYGFTAYSGSKYALRGFAEALQMEVKPYSIYVTMSFPPDTDTPGYKEEMKDKPKETCLISETSGLFQASSVAKALMKDAQKGKFLSYNGLDGYMLANVTAGMSPLTSVADGLQQILTMSIFRAISIFYLVSFDRIVRKCKEEAEAEPSGDKNKHQ